MTLLLVFEILVEPAEELSVPHYIILWLEYLMCLVLEYYQTRWDTLHASCGEGLEALGEGDTVVLLACEDEDGGVPLLGKLVG